MMPTKEEVEAEARKRFALRNESLGVAINPEREELGENGDLVEAQRSLMTDHVAAQFRAYLEEQARDLGLRLVSEADHDKLVDLKLRLDRIRQREKALKVPRVQFEHPSLDVPVVRYMPDSSLEAEGVSSDGKYVKLLVSASLMRRLNRDTQSLSMQRGEVLTFRMGGRKNMSLEEKLVEYRRKRNFNRTPEPRGKEAR